MKFRPIITLPEPGLRVRSKKISFIDEDTHALAEEMKTATLNWEDSRPHEVGVALAAVQINDNRRVVVIRNNFDNKEDREFHVLLNPEITKYEGEQVADYEGCLSVQDVYGKVPRYTKIRVKALNLQGEEVRMKADGFLARVLQHEIDHLNGIVFVDHIKDKKEAFYTLTDKGNLEKLDYDTDIVNNSILW